MRRRGHDAYPFLSGEKKVPHGCQFISSLQSYWGDTKREKDFSKTAGWGRERASSIVIRWGRKGSRRTTPS